NHARRLRRDLRLVWLERRPEGACVSVVVKRRCHTNTADKMSAVPPELDPRLRELTLLRRVRDRMDREYAQPLDVEALARGVHMSAGHLSRQFKIAYGESPYSYLMT